MELHYNSSMTDPLSRMSDEKYYSVIYKIL